ncbi:AraC family transcriptional regulator [Maritimibacter alkaliphilus]|uniref:AraC family transcriptional regulator n=1 Tax=Maritimibacter alkaliphilus TaxID=404236 RepID=UPI001C94E80D|nr:helix-turn-helix transcriptional regulator [Maritimibacter alkaliphilus]MBY6093107.1 helix-turn-helix transcriptional regulator [Maritimibacter alkaliphilus]
MQTLDAALVAIRPRLERAERGWKADTPPALTKLSTGRRDNFVVTRSEMRRDQASRWHRHAEMQILYLLDGLLSLTIDSRSHLVTRGHAVWIPSTAAHQVHASKPSAVMSAYLEPAEWDAITPFPMGSFASPTAGVLLEKLINTSPEHRSRHVDEAVLTLLQDETSTELPLALSVSMPKDPRLLTVCRELLRAPQKWQRKAELAAVGNMSVRTMSRLFRAELGLTYSEWAQDMLVHRAIAMLQDGMPVTTVAFDLSYDSHSAFTAMSRRLTGRSPSEWRDRR